MQIGDKFEVMEWIKCPCGDKESEYIGKQCVKIGKHIMTPGEGIVYYFSGPRVYIKKIGVLKVTKLKQ